MSTSATVMATCEACGQPLPEPAAVAAAADGLQALLTDEERGRGVRKVHELGHARQVVVRAALKAGGVSAAKDCLQI